VLHRLDTPTAHKTAWAAPCQCSSGKQPLAITTADQLTALLPSLRRAPGPDSSPHCPPFCAEPRYLGNRDRALGSSSRHHNKPGATRKKWVWRQAPSQEATGPQQPGPALPQGVQRLRRRRRPAVSRPGGGAQATVSSRPGGTGKAVVFGTFRGLPAVGVPEAVLPEAENGGVVPAVLRDDTDAALAMSPSLLSLFQDTSASRHGMEAISLGRSSSFPWA